MTTYRTQYKLSAHSSKIVMAVLNMSLVRNAGEVWNPTAVQGCQMGGAAELCECPGSVQASAR